MQGYAIMLLVVFVFRFRVLYMAPLVQTATHTISLALVVVVASPYAAVRLLQVLTNKGVPPKGKRVVFTRCDSGYGNRLALELDRRGLTVVAGCVSEGSPGSRLHKEQRNIHVVDTDVTQTESLAELEKYVRALCKDDSHLWAVIINLSVVSLGELEWYDDHDMRWTYEVNVLCVARTARVFPLPRKTPYCGRRYVIVNSVGSRVAVQSTGPYCMSKHAVRCFIEVLLRELLKFGIYVVGIEPNLYRLPQTELSSRLKSYECMWNKLPNDVKNIYSKGYADEMEENIRRAIATEPEPIVLDVAKEMLDAVQTAYPSKIYQPDFLSWKILYAGFRLLPDEITDFSCMDISGLMKSELKMILRLCDD